jgi:hypothetical protein
MQGRRAREVGSVHISILFSTDPTLLYTAPLSKLDCTETHLYDIIQLTALELLCRVLGTHEGQQEGLQISCAAA